MKCPREGCDSKQFITTVVKEVGNNIVRTKQCIKADDDGFRMCKAEFQTIETIIPFDATIVIYPKGTTPPEHGEGYKINK